MAARALTVLSGEIRFPTRYRSHFTIEQEERAACPMHTNLPHANAKAMRMFIYKVLLKERGIGIALSGSGYARMRLAISAG
jgi:hypothetical protein